MRSIIFTALITLSCSLVSYAQGESEVAERSPLITKYESEDGAELLIIATESDVTGYYKADGKVDSIRFGSFTPDEVALYLKSDNNLKGKYKNLDNLKLKLTDRGFNKLGKYKFERVEGDEWEIQQKVIDHVKFTPESGIATYSLDGTGDELIFSVWWEIRKTVGSYYGEYKGYQGIAKKVKDDGDFIYYQYRHPDESLETTVYFQLNKKNNAIILFVDSEDSSSLGGLEPKEKIHFKTL